MSALASVAMTVAIFCAIGGFAFIITYFDPAVVRKREQRKAMRNPRGRFLNRGVMKKPHHCKPPMRGRRLDDMWQCYCGHTYVYTRKRVPYEYSDGPRWKRINDKDDLPEPERIVLPEVTDDENVKRQMALARACNERDARIAELEAMLADDHTPEREVQKLRDRVADLEEHIQVMELDTEREDREVGLLDRIATLEALLREARGYVIGRADQLVERIDAALGEKP